MEPEAVSRSGFSLKGSAGIIVAVVVVAVLLIMLPAYRWFFLISVLIGLVIALGLTLWHRLHPIEEQDVQTKRPRSVAGRL
jgi:MFS family permease